MASLLLVAVMTGCNKDDVVGLECGSAARPILPGSSPRSTVVYEYMPGPGQFINENNAASGMTEPVTTLGQACRWAERRLADNRYVSLGAFGGYIVVGFDHSIMSSGLEYDFVVEGNAFLSKQGGSNEPGIVWVMQDTDGNGRPDDIWYELKGSEDDNPATKKGYSVTYYRPEAPGLPVRWTDSEGGKGEIDYLKAFHKQDYYYPQWVPTDSYTLTGTCLPARNTIDPVSGFWNNAEYDWGYADNIGSDNLGGDSLSGDGQRTGFRIENAVDADGLPVDLDFIDFIKVQTGVLAKSGWLGELSTEVFGFSDYYMLSKSGRARVADLPGN